MPQIYRDFPFKAKELEPYLFPSLKAKVTEGRSLSAEERLQYPSLHFCWEWDGMLIDKTDEEFECCTCFDWKNDFLGEGKSDRPPRQPT